MQQLPELRVFDANQPMQNYLAGRENVRQINRQESGDKQNALLMAQRQEDRGLADQDRMRRIGQEDNALSVAADERRIKRAQDMGKQISEAVASEIPNLNTALPDDQYQEQAFQFGDGLGTYLSKVYGMPKEEVTPLVKRALGAIGNRARVKAYQMAAKNKMAKEGQTVVAPGSTVYDAQGNALATAKEKSQKAETSSDYADLVAVLGRKPTAAELKDYKKSGAKGGDELREERLFRFYGALKNPDGTPVFTSQEEILGQMGQAKTNPQAEARSIATTIFTAQNDLPPDQRKDYNTIYKDALDLIQGGRPAGGGNALAPKAAPTSPAKTVTPEIAKDFLNKAGGDKAKARAMAKQQGYQF